MRFPGRLWGKADRKQPNQRGVIDSLATMLVLALRRNPQYDPSSLMIALVGVRDATLLGLFVPGERPTLMRQLRSEATSPDIQRERAELADGGNTLAGEGHWSALFKESASTVKPEYLGAYAFFESNCGRAQDEVLAEANGERPQASRWFDYFTSVVELQQISFILEHEVPQDPEVSYARLIQLALKIALAASDPHQTALERLWQARPKVPPTVFLEAIATAAERFLSSPRPV
jgi:hypothetical protein